MMAGGNLIYLALVFFILLSKSDGQRLRDNMYESLYGSGACYKRYNGTHEIGCSSKHGGTVGIVHIYNDDINWILDKSKSGPYAVVLSIEMFTKDLVMRFIDRPDKIAGLLVINNGTRRPENFTPQQRCPNVGSQAPWETLQCKENGADSQVWNPWGSGLMYLNYPFPIFYIPPDKIKDVQNIYDCFKKFNAFDLDNQPERSLCAIEMDSFMYGAVSSEVCMRRSNINKHLSPTRYCDPLGDKSIYTTLFSRSPFQEPSHDYFMKIGTGDTVDRSPVKELPGSVALVTAAMDGTSFFEAEGINAVGTVSGMVVLMATNQLLHRMFTGYDNTDYEKNVLFVLLNGESFDYIGSQRMAWDLSTKSFLEPVMDVKALGPHIHLGQLTGKKRSSLNVFTPKYKEEDKNKKVDEFLTWMNISSALYRDQQIPPSSVHSFLRILNTSETNLASAVIADHGMNFDSKYYQSVFDDVENLEYKYLNISFDTSNLPPDAYPDFPDDQVPADSLQARLASISTSLGHALYRHVTGKPYDGNLTSSSYVIDELLHCYLDTVTCRLVTAAVSSSPSEIPPQNIPPVSLYVGVSVWPTQHSRIGALLTALLTGRHINRTKEECKSVDDNICWYTWMSGWSGNGTCVRTHTNYITALSPAFEINDYDFASGKYSTWAESVWSGLSLRLLVKPPHRHEVVILSVGICVALVSTLLVALCTKHIAALQPESSQRERVEEDESVNC